MFKKISSLLCIAVFAIIMLSNLGQIVEAGVITGTNQCLVGVGRSAGYTYDWSPAGVKATTNELMVLICNSMVLEDARAQRTVKVLPQASWTSTDPRNMYANTVALTYTFGEGFNDRLVNGYTAGMNVTMRFKGEPNSFITNYYCIYYYN